MIPERDHNISRSKINLRIGEVTVTIPDCLQRYNKIHPSRIFADNCDQIHLIRQCFTGLGIETQVTIYPTTRNSRLPTTVTSQILFALLRQTMKLLNYWDYAL